MFNWTTTNLINEIPSNLAVEGSGKLRIGKYLFEKRWVETIRKAEGKKEEICELNLDLSKVSFGEAEIARLYIYVGLEGSSESIYANDFYNKGLPLSISFAVLEDKEAMAKAIEDSIKTFNAFTKGKKILEVKATGSVLNIKGTHEHQRIKKLAILTENLENSFSEENVVLEFIPKHKNDDNEESNPIEVVAYGQNGFGTYSQLIKDLRLPTAPNNHWLSVNKNEMPVVGSLYTQYIITYYAPSTSNPSFTAVGNRSMSETTHVFWVKSDLIKDWEDLLKEIDPDGDNDLNTIPNENLEGLYENKQSSLIDDTPEETPGE